MIPLTYESGVLMKISDIINASRISISFELFPPKEWTGLEQTKSVAHRMAEFSPSFMSVTYGAGGTTGNFTREIAEEINNTLGIPALAHLTCRNSKRPQVNEVLANLKASGIENILALRGDPPKDPSFVVPNDFRYAYELVELIKSQGDFCVGGACYPEGHPESPSMESDIDYLKVKAECGVDFFTSQMFFDNNIFYAFRYRMLKKHIETPVIAGIMPVTNGKQINRLMSLSGSVLPPRFKAIVDRFGDNPDAMKQAGIAYATEQIIDLIANGVNNIHIYTMNRPDVAGAIMANLSDVIRIDL